MQKVPITIYYQSSCALCAECRTFVEARDVDQRCVFKDGTLAPESAHYDPRDSIIVDHEGREYRKFEAVLQILSVLKSPWPFVAKVARVVPTQVGDRLYAFVALHRGGFLQFYKAVRKIVSWMRNLFFISLPLMVGTAVIVFLVYGSVRLFPQKTYEAFIQLGIESQYIGVVFAQEPDYLVLLGERHLGGGGTYDVKRAAKFFEAAIAVREDTLFAHYQLARTYFLRSRYGPALEHVNTEIRNNPDFARSYYLRGLIYGYRGDLELAAQDFKIFIKKKPDEWAGYADLSWVLFQLGDYQGVSDYMEVILKTRKNAWLLNAYGVALLNLGYPNDALTILSEARDLASRMTSEMWGTAYIGNNPAVYGIGLEEMRVNIDENIERVNNVLSKK